jgi:nucleoside-diphosphate-sugar epimerase
MKVLVTGATGLLGRHLVDVLIAEGVTVRAFARPSSDVQRLQQLSTGVEIVRGSWEDGELLRRLVQDVQVIFHLAAYLNTASPFSSNGGSPLYRRLNVDFTARLLEVGEAAGVPRFVFASSSSVYGAEVPVPTPEDAPLAPEGAYARSKAAAEEVVRAWAARGGAATILRPALSYGPGDRHFVPVARSLSRLPLLPLVNGGETLLDMVYAGDVAELMWRAAQRDEAGSRTYNAGPGAPTSLKALVAAFRQVTGRAPHIVPISAGMVLRLSHLVAPLAARLAPGLEATLSPRGVELMCQDIHLDMRRAALFAGRGSAADLGELGSGG